MNEYLRKRLARLKDRLAIPIPSLFHSVETDQPFDHCSQCRVDLIPRDLYYLVEKVWHEQEVIVEYALCEHCLRQLSGETSEESARTMRQQYRRRKRRIKGVDACGFCAMPREELNVYHLMAHCLGPHLLPFYRPMLVCQECVADMAEGLSAETRDRMDRFEQDLLPGPPGDASPLPVDLHLFV